MNLIQFREFFAKQSGRFDLVFQSTWKNRGLDNYVRAAVKHLDRRADIRESLAEQEITLNADQVSLEVEFLAVHDVYLVDASADKQSALCRLEHDEARRLYASDAGFSSIDSATPKYYVIGISRGQRTVPELDRVRKILILPPSKTQETILVKGSLHQKSLLKDGDENFWTLEEPFILALCIQLLLEKAQRNSAGVADLETALEQEIRFLEHETIEETQHYRDHRANSWRYINELRIPFKPEGQASS